MSWDILLRNAATTAFTVVCIAMGAAVNARYQTHDGDTVQLAVAVFSATTAALALIGLTMSIREGYIFGAAVCLIAFLPATGWNFVNALGVAANIRDATVTKRGDDSSNKERLLALWETYSSSRKDLARDAGNKASRVLQAELAALREDQKWAQTKNCEDATIPASRAFCAGYRTTEGQLAAAQRAEEIDGKLEELNGRIGAIQGGKGRAADPQANVVSFALAFLWRPFDDKTIGSGLSLMFAIVVWSFDSFGPVMFKVVVDPKRRVRKHDMPAPVTPVHDMTPAAPPAARHDVVRLTQPQPGMLAAPKTGLGRAPVNNVVEMFHAKPAKAAKRTCSCADVIAAKKLKGSNSAAALHLGISERQIYRILKEAKNSAASVSV